MNDDLESEYAARFDDHAERWASEREDVRRSDLADREEATRETAGPRCCEDPTPAEHEGQRYFQACDADLCAFCNAPAVAGHSDRAPLCAKCWTEEAIG